MHAILQELLTTRWIVTSIAAGTLLWRRDLSTALCLAGAVLNALLSKVLKRLLKSPRPSGAPLADPGMPSSHAQSLFYLATYVSLALLDSPDYSVAVKATASLVIVLGVRALCHTCAARHPRLLPTLEHLHPPLPAPTSAPDLLDGRPQAAGAALHRVHAGLHTLAQIGVGATIGSTFAGGWLYRAQPALELAMGRLEDGSAGSWLLLGLAVVGLAVVGSVERLLSAELKRRKAR